MKRWLGSVSTALLLAGCGQGWLVVGSSTGSIDGASQRATIRVQAFDGAGAPAEGTVELDATAGELVEGATLRLSAGFGTRTFRCDPAADPRCAGQVTITARWEGHVERKTIHVTQGAPPSPAAPRFTVVPTMSTAALDDLALDGEQLWAAGATGTVLRLVEGAWEGVSTGTRADLHAIAVSPSGQLAVAGEGTVLLEEGAGFSSHAVEGSLLAAAWGPDGALFLGTAAGSVLRLEPGHAPTTELWLGPRIGQLLERDGVIWAVAEGVVARRELDGAWSVERSPVLAFGVKAALDGEQLLVGGKRTDGPGGWILTTLSQDGQLQWSASPTTATVSEVVVTPAGTPMALSGSALLVEADGGWAALPLPCEGTAAVSRGEADLVIVGPPGISLVRVP